MTDMIIQPGLHEKTAILQAAIDAVSDAGGGRVVLAAGQHLTGGLRLKSNVELHLSLGAVLRALPDYDAYSGNVVGVVAEESDRAILYASRADNITISGPGQILAPGQAYIIGDDPGVGTFTPAKYRPRVLVLEDCTEVRLEGFAIVDSPMWTLHLVACNAVTIRHVQVRNNERLPNTDGMVIDSCVDVLVDTVDISTADDGVCLKTTRRQNHEIGTCRDITVRHCAVSSQSCALKLGTESFGDFINILFEDCKISNSNRALGIFSRDGGRVENVVFRRITVDCHETPDGFWGSGEAITVTVADRRAERPAGSVSSILFEDITGRMQGAINLVSHADIARISDVVLRRVCVEQMPGALGTGQNCDMRPTSADLAPAKGMQGRANAWVRDLTGKILGLEPYPGGMPGIFAPDIDGLVLDAIEIRRPLPLPQGWNAQERICRKK
jgi:polygalacturonase